MGFRRDDGALEGWMGGGTVWDEVCLGVVWTTPQCLHLSSLCCRRT